MRFKIRYEQDWKNLASEPECAKALGIPVVAYGCVEDVYNYATANDAQSVIDEMQRRCGHPIKLSVIEDEQYEKLQQWEEKWETRTPTATTS